jgi:voltage-gated potassium channel Kch
MSGKVTKALLAIPTTMAMPFVITFRALRAIWRDPDSRNIVVAAGMLLAAGTLIFAIIEDLSLIDGFYFSFITLSTIGYGDISPATDIGKIVAVIYGIAGLGIIAALISSIASQHWHSGRRRAQDENEAKDEGAA